MAWKSFASRKLFTGSIWGAGRSLLSVRHGTTLPPRVQHRTAVGARWHLPRGVRRARIFHRPKDQFQHSRLVPFIGNSGYEVGITGVSAVLVNDDEVSQAGCRR